MSDENVVDTHADTLPAPPSMEPRTPCADVPCDEDGCDADWSAKVKGRYLCAVHAAASR